MKKIKIVLGICFFVLSMSFCMKEERVYAAENEYVDEVNEDSEISVMSYSDEKQMYLGLLNTNNELCADIVITIYFEYADNSWVEVEDAKLSIQCYNGYQVSVSSNRVYGSGGSSDFCRREFTILYPSGMHAYYHLYAYADYYGEVDYLCQLISTY